MRILLAGTFRAVVGGAQTYQRDLLEALAARGHEVALLHELAAPLDAEILDAGAPGLPRWCVAELGAAGALEGARGWYPDVTYVQGLESPSLEAKLVHHVPAVLFAHNYYGTCETGTKRHAFPRLEFCTRTLGPMCLLLHYPRRCGGLDPTTMVYLYRQQIARRRTLLHYRAICVASRHMYDEYRRHRISAERLHITPLPPPGIQPDSEPPRQREPSGRLLFMARLTELKGGHHLLRALPGAAYRLGASPALTVAGDGPERERLQRLARALQVDVEFHGWVDLATRDRLLRAADLLVMPSLWPEPWGLAGLEAACVGVPTVAFAGGGIPEWLIPGENGELAPADPPTPAGLADALVRALGDREHYARLCRGAWQWARAFTMERHLSQVEQVLMAATEKRK